MFDIAVFCLKRMAFNILKCLLLAAVLAAVILMVISTGEADDAEVDANIITALDVSDSVDSLQTMVQIQGMAEAIRSPAVVHSILAGDRGRIGFMVFVWADGDFPELVSWRSIASQEDADAAAAEILAKLDRLMDPSKRNLGYATDLSAALDNAAQVALTAPFRSERILVNVIGNGPDNIDEGPALARAALLTMGATINGVVTGGKPEVVTYYRKEVTGGPHHFTLEAASPEDIANIFATKFRIEIAQR